MEKEKYIKKYKGYWRDPEEMFEEINKRYKELGAVAFVITHFSRRIRNLNIKAIQDAIE